TQDQINIDLASLNDNEFRRLEDLPPMLKWAVPRLLEAKKKQMVSLKELEQRVSAQIKLVGRELIKWQSESYPLKKAAVPLLARTLEDTIRAFEEQANAPAPADVAYLRDEQAEMVDCARRAHGWNALEPTLDRAGSWLNFYDSELQRLQNRIKEDNKQAEAAPLKNEFERRLDSAEDNLRYALEQEDLQDFERVLAAYEFIKRLLMNTLKSNLNNFESGLEDAGDTNVTPVKTELSKIRKFMEYPWLDTPQQVVDALTKTIDELIKVGNQQEAPLKDQLQKLTGELNVFVENWTLMVVTPFNHFNGVLAIGQNRQTQQSIDRRIPGAFLSRVRESFKELKREEKKYEQTRADKRESTWRDELDDRESDIRERLITEMRREAAREVATENKRNDIQSRLLGVIRTQARQDFRAKDYLSDEEETRITDQLNSLNEARRALGLPEIDFPENKKRVAEQLQFLSVSLRDIFPDLSKDDTTPLAKLLRAARDGLNNLEKTIGAKERYSFEDEEAYVEEQVKASEIRVKNEANEEIDTAEGRRAIESVVSEKLRNYESSYRGAGPYERSAVEACEEIARYAEHELRRVESWESYGYEFPLLRERAKHLQRGVRELRKESAGDLLTHLVDRKLPNLDTKLLKLTRAASIGKEVVQSLESEFTAIQLELESDPDLPKLETSAAALKLIEFFDRAIQLNNKIDELVSRHQANIRDRMQDIWDLIKERTEQVKAQKAAESDEDKAEIQKKIKRIELSLNAQLKIVKGWRWGRQEAAVVTRAFGKDKAPALTMRSSAIRKGNLDNEYQSIVGTLNSDKHRRALMAGAIPQSLTIEKLTQWQGELEIMEKKKQELGERIGKLNAQVDLENDIGTLESAAAIFKDIWQSHPDLEAPLSERSSAPVSAEEMLRSVERWSNALTKQKEKFLQIPVDVKDEKPLEEIKATLDLIREAIEKKLKDPEFQKAKKNYLMKQNQRVEARQERLNSVQKMMDSLSSLGSYLSMAYGYEEQTQRSAANHKYFLSSSEPGDNVTTFLNWGHHPLAPDAYRILSGEQQNDGLARLEAAVEPVSYAMQAYQELQPAPGGELFLGSEFKNRSLLGKASRYLRQSSLAAMGSSAAMSSKVPEGAVRVMEEKEGKLVPGEEIRRDIRPKPEMNEANKAMWDWLKGAGLSVATKFYWAPNEFTDGAGLNIPQNTCIDYIPGDKPGEPEASFIVRDPDPRIDQALRVPADWVPKDERESLIKKIDNLKKAVEISRNNGSGISPGEIKQPYQVAHKTIACLRAEELQKVETKDQVKGRGPSRK
ncbi:MAG TPA: hypothetical protein VM532_14115, partial [Burkholderiales bacterium]|nr:hypothetical protein [Burkholderiales bacterium]